MALYECLPVNVIHSDLRLMLLATFRYSLGRKTYMVEFAASMIKEHIWVLKHHDLNGIIDEIEHALNLNQAGLDEDEEVWKDLIEYINDYQRGEL